MSTARGKAVKGLSTMVAILQTIWTQIRLNNLTRNPNVSFLDINDTECTLIYAADIISI